MIQKSETTPVVSAVVMIRTVTFKFECFALPDMNRGDQTVAPPAQTKVSGHRYFFWVPSIILVLRKHGPQYIGRYRSKTKASNRWGATKRCPAGANSDGAGWLFAAST